MRRRCEWILDGMPRRVREDRELREALETRVIRTPAWRGRLSDAQVDDLVAYLRALAAPDLPEDPAVRTGYVVAEQLGYFRCHGPGGRGAGRNPGSLKGYIPPWDGHDFTELVADDAELREWIRAMIREAATKMNRGAKVRRTTAQRTAQSDRPSADR